MSTNATADPCAGFETSLRTPQSFGSFEAYAAIGPLFNFTAAATDCCPRNGTVSNFVGGPAPQSCYYLCAFNGTETMMHETMACNRGAAGERQRAAQRENRTSSGWVGVGNHPDSSQNSGVGGHRERNWGVWKCVVLALGVVGFTAGMA